MEYVEGTNLSSLLTTRGAPPIRHSCEWVRQAALGLGHAHDQGLIHRDVKPSNLLLTAKGNIIKVMDLGLARLDLLGEPEPETPNAPLTESGVVIGTPDYMAPEQAIAPRSADARADIYSLGCTLYHLLTGRPPFPGGSLTQKLLWHQQSEPKDPSRLRASLPPGLSRLVLKMLAKDPAARPVSAGDVAVELAPYCSAAVLKTLPATEPPRPAELELEPFGSPSTPMVHHTPGVSDPYELAQDPNELTVIDEPTPVGLSKPAEEGDDSWWKDEVADRGSVGPWRPSHQPGLPRPVETTKLALAEKPVRSPRGYYLIGLAIVVVAAIAWFVLSS
jgi:serine/threonine protein kinase